MKAAKRSLIEQDMEKTLPEDVWIEEILLKLPAKSLWNLRYVSKYFWNLITNPSFVKLHLKHSTAQLNNHLLLISSQNFIDIDNRTHRLIVNATHNYVCNFPWGPSSCSNTDIVEIHCPFEHTEIRASCNGLLLLHRRSMIHGHYDDTNFTNYIWNPCTREIKVLPPPPPTLLLLDLDVGDYEDEDFALGGGDCSSKGFCGFGYDRANDQYKVLRYENRIRSNVDTRYSIISSIIEFKLHTLGTNNYTWRSIHDNPYKSFFFGEPSKRMGLLVNGALHWIMRPSGRYSDIITKIISFDMEKEVFGSHWIMRPSGRYSDIITKIISFDMEKEAFGEIQKPALYYPDKEEVSEKHYYCSESIQVLEECLCICEIHFHVVDLRIDIWMLQDYKVMDTWTKLFSVVIPNKDNFDYHEFRLLRYCENGEILMLRDVKDMIVYDPVNHKARRAKKFNQVVKCIWQYYLDYTESLVSLSQFSYLH